MLFQLLYMQASPEEIIAFARLFSKSLIEFQSSASSVPPLVTPEALSEKDPKKAARILGRFLYFHPNNVDVHLARAKLREKMGFDEKAITLYNHVLKLDTKNIEALTARSRLYRKKSAKEKDEKLAEEYKTIAAVDLRIALEYRREQKKEPISEQKKVLDHYVECAKRKNEIAGIMAELRDVAKQIKTRRTQLFPIYKMNPNLLHPEEPRSQYYFQQEREQEEEMKKSVNIKLLTSEESMKMAELIYQCRQAKEKLNAANFKWPSTQDLKNPQTVIDDFVINDLLNEIIHRCEYSLISYVIRSNFYRARGMLDLAIQDLSKIINLNFDISNNKTRAYFARAVCFFHKKQHAELMEDKDEITRSLIAFKMDFVRGLMHIKLNDSDKFYPERVKCVDPELFKNFYEVEVALSTDLLSQEKIFSNADPKQIEDIKKYTQRIIRDPLKSHLFLDRADIYRQMKFYFLAIEDLTIAIYLLLERINENKETPVTSRGHTSKERLNLKICFEMRGEIFLQVGLLNFGIRDHQCCILSYDRTNKSAPNIYFLNTTFNNLKDQFSALLVDCVHKQESYEEAIRYLNTAVEFDSDNKNQYQKIEEKFKSKKTTQDLKKEPSKENVEEQEKAIERKRIIKKETARIKKECAAMRGEDSRSKTWYQEERIKIRQEEKRKRKEIAQCKKNEADALEEKLQREQKLIQEEKIKQEVKIQLAKEQEKKELVKEIKIQLPVRVIDLPARLNAFADRVTYLEEKSQKQIYLVGGAVCLALLNKIDEEIYIDKDCATDIPYEEFSELFKQLPAEFKRDLKPNTQLTHTHWLDEVDDIKDRTVRYSKLDYFDIDTSRSRSLGETFRHNPRIAKSNGLKRDDKTRDTTISSMFGRVKKIEGQYKMEIYDPTGFGLADLFATPPRIRLIASVPGFSNVSPREFLTEDPVRILRLFRQAAKYDAKLEEEDKKLIHKIDNKKRLFACKKNDTLYFRLNDQIRKIAKSKNADEAKNEMKRLGVWSALHKDIQKNFEDTREKTLSQLRTRYGSSSPTLYAQPVNNSRMAVSDPPHNLQMGLSR